MWTLIVIKAFAAAGLAAGIWIPGVAFATNVAVIGYFIAATIAHIRARNYDRKHLKFWAACLGMLALAIGVLAVSYLYAL